MSPQDARPFSRRKFLSEMTLVGTAGLLGLHARQGAAEPAPETPRLRLYKFPGICLAPQYIAEELLRAEGFTDVQYVEFSGRGQRGV
jgi:NitT/TauT family transport system substrate-binding protein